MTRTERLFYQCLNFCDEFRISRTRFGRLYMRDPNFIRDLERGRAPTPRSVDRVLGAMRRAREAEKPMGARKEA